MSGFKAIRAVSSTLKSLLSSQMEDQPVSVTLLPPDIAPTTATGRRINLYLYMVTENGFLSNQELPGEGHPNSYGHPPLSLNLHYLVTGYSDSDAGDDRDLAAQETLGDGMRVLHDFPIIPGNAPFLDSELQNAFERIKIALQPVSLDDLAKIWTALPSANFRCSAVYNVTVIQIQSLLPRQLAAPVKTRRLHMSLAKLLKITDVYRTPIIPGDPIGDVRVSIGQNITITGDGFAAPKTWVKLGGLEPIGVVPLPNGDIVMAVPDDTYPTDFDHATTRPILPGDRLPPGPQMVQVLVQRDGEGIQGGLDRGKTFAEAVIQASNQSVFVLVPAISNISPLSGTSGATLTVLGTRLFRSGMKTFVYFNDVAIEALSPQTDTQVQVPLTAITKVVPPLQPRLAPYPVRIQVNGALSVEEKGFTLT